jgi:hypothetical protein
MTGYWRWIIESGHKTGPYRTSIKSIQNYIKSYDDPQGKNNYHSAGYNKINGKVKSKPTMLSSKFIPDLEGIETREKGSMPIIVIELTSKEVSQFMNKEKMLNVLRRDNEENYQKYKSYEISTWVMDTPDKCSKWRLSSMLKSNAYSTTTNIHDKEKNIMMMYLHEHKVIINVWNGKLTE